MTPVQVRIPRRHVTPVQVRIPRRHVTPVQVRLPRRHVTPVQVRIPRRHVTPVQVRLPRRHMTPVQVRLPRRHVTPVQVRITRRHVTPVQVRLPRRYVTPVQVRLPRRYVTPVQVRLPRRYVTPVQVRLPRRYVTRVQVRLPRRYVDVNTVLSRLTTRDVGWLYIYSDVTCYFFAVEHRHVKAYWRPVADVNRSVPSRPNVRSPRRDYARTPARKIATTTDIIDQMFSLRSNVMTTETRRCRRSRENSRSPASWPTLSYARGESPALQSKHGVNVCSNFRNVKCECQQSSTIKHCSLKTLSP